jgi:hypothetical protein
MNMAILRLWKVGATVPHSLYGPEILYDNSLLEQVQAQSV